MDVKVLFADAKEAGITEIEVYTVKKSASEIGIFNHEVETLRSNSTNVSYIRGAYNGHLGAVYVENNNLSNAEIINVIKENASLLFLSL